MDTISSRENNSFLPIAGLIVGILALGAVLFAFSKLSKAKDEIATLTEKVSGMESLVQSASSTADAAKSQASTAMSYAKQLEGQVNGAFGQVSTELGTIKGELEKLKTGPVKTTTGPKGEKAPAVAGEGEYIVKKGDIGTTIAKANNCSIQDLIAVNPGVNWSKLKIGDKIKLPKK